MEDDEFNTLKFSLPFLLKIDKDQFFDKVSYLKRQVPIFTTFQLIDLFYTFHSLAISKIWITFLVDIFDLLPLKYQIDVVKFSCSCADDHVETLKPVIDKVFEKIGNDEDLISEFSFSNSKFFKPILSSQLKSIKFVNKILSLYITEKTFVLSKRIDTHLKCLEKLQQYRKLSDIEVEYLLSLLKIPELKGRVLDICLHSDNSPLLENAFEILNEERTGDIYSDDNAVHYFEITPETSGKISNVNADELLKCIGEFLDISRIILESLDKVYYFANMILTSDYKLGSLSIEKIFVFVWSQCDFEMKKSLIEEIITYDTSICCYGIVVNLLVYVAALKEETYMTPTVDYVNKREALSTMRKQYPDDHEIWSDPEKIKEILGT
jgi:hypothetical protein